MISIVVLGEKDHGKSTLVGRLIYETKSMPADRLWEIRRAAKKSGRAFEWAHLLDSFRYEREREMTLDTTRACVRLGKNLYEFIDVPGHKKFIRNMLTGASDATCGILVIDAKEGITPQTLKHIEIARFLGIEKIIVAINKIDRINYSASLFKEMIKIFADALRRHGLKHETPFIPIVAHAGHNLIRKTAFTKQFLKPTLAESIQKNFTPVHAKKTSVSHAPKARDHKANCLFVEKPKAELVLESDGSVYQISKLLGMKKIYSPQNVLIKLAKAAVLTKKFVIKSKGRTIGMCAHN